MRDYFIYLIWEPLLTQSECNRRSILALPTPRVFTRPLASGVHSFALLWVCALRFALFSKILTVFVQVKPCCKQTSGGSFCTLDPIVTLVLPIITRVYFVLESIFEMTRGVSKIPRFKSAAVYSPWSRTKTTYDRVTCRNGKRKITH